ncbi:MAG TPA: lytic transglycosylase domain-containing protein [Myxococcales bacterium]|nr:lytic transglycosylase domain-containing protein [Myxococcales bacterium]
MNSPSAKTILAVCAILILAGGAAEVYLLPRAVPRPASRFRDSPPPSLSQARMESLLARAGKQLDPALRTKLAEAVLTESARAGYDPLFVLALVAVESGFRPMVSSERGAYGLMQLKPSTFAWIAGREPDIAEDSMVMEDPVIDVRLAVRYLRWLEHRFPKRDEALMAYNAGPRRMQQYKKSGIPDSLREYPRRVMKEYRRFVRMMNEPELREVVVAQAN